MIENIVYGVGGWLGGLLTTFILRWARKEHITEGLGRLDAAISIKKRMREEGLTEEEIASVMRMATRRSYVIEKVVEDAEAEDFTTFNEDMSQAEMNRAAWQRYEKLDLEMRHTFATAEAETDGKQLELLRKSQEAWEQYRKIVGEMYGQMQGTMWPMVGAFVLWNITKRRIEDLKSERGTFREAE